MRTKPMSGAAWLALLGLLCAGAAAQAGIGVWTDTGLITQGNEYINAIAVDPQDPATVYAGSSAAPAARIFKTTDGGGTWTLEDTGLGALGVDALVIDPQSPTTVYAGARSTPGGGGGVFKSTDGGGTWNLVNTGLTIHDVSALAIDPRDPSVIYAGTSNGGYAGSTYGGVFKTTDAGATWDRMSTGLNSTMYEVVVDALAIDPQNPETVYAGTFGPGVFKTTDGGGQWGNVLPELIVEGLAIDPQDSALVYAPGWFMSITTDGGQSWLALVDVPARSVVVDAGHPGTAFAGSPGGVVETTDGGETWDEKNAGLMNLSVHSLAIDSQNPATVYAGTEAGVFAYTEPFCGTGDCNGDGVVTPEEVAALVDAIFAPQPSQSCPTLNDGAGAADLVAAVRNAASCA